MPKKMEVLNRLRAELKELNERLKNQHAGGSQRKENLEYKIKTILELIRIYQKRIEEPDFLEAEKIFSEHVGFEDLKSKILKKIEVTKFCEKNNILIAPSIITLIGPPGTGKTSFGKILSSALKREFFSINLNEISKDHLLGKSENFSGSEIGKLTEALIKTNSPNPLILLDEIEKADYSTKNALISLLDKNKETTDYFLNIKLDFSKVFFLVTTNDKSKIPSFILSRLGNSIFELEEGYNTEEKKQIALNFIHDFFSSNPELGKKIKITSEALENLIKKTREKGVRQLIKSLEEDIISYCLRKWKGQNSGFEEIEIDSDLIDQIVNYSFPEIGQENNEESKFENLLKKKDLKIAKTNALLILEKRKKIFSLSDYNEKVQEINLSDSEDEIKKIIKAISLNYPQEEKANSNENLEKEINNLKNKINLLESSFSQKKSNLDFEKNYLIIFIVSIMIFIILKIIIKKQKKNLKIK